MFFVVSQFRRLRMAGALVLLLVLSCAYGMPFSLHLEWHHDDAPGQEQGGWSLHFENAAVLDAMASGSRYGLCHDCTDLHECCRSDGDHDPWWRQVINRAAGGKAKAFPLATRRPAALTAMKTAGVFRPPWPPLADRLRLAEFLQTLRSVVILC